MIKNKHFDKINIVYAGVLLLFLLYMFFYQFSIGIINGAFIAFGLLFLLYILLKLNTFLKIYKRFLPFLALLIVFGFSSLILSENIKSSMGALLTICEYLIPMISVCIFVAEEKNKGLHYVLAIISLSILVLSLNSIFQGVSTTTGAITSGTLNTNVFSSFLLIGTFCNLYLAGQSKKFIVSLLFYILSIFNAFTQLYAASRRGVIVLLILFLSFLLLSIGKKQKKIVALNIVSIASFIVILFAIANTTSLSSLVVIQRFLSVNNVGDENRKIFQSVAIDIFKYNPLFGGGLNAVDNRIGMYSHSFYYELLACGGLFAFVLTLFFFARELFVLIKNRRGANNSSNLMFAVLIICFLISGFTVVFIYDLYFYIFVGLLISHELRKDTL